MVTPNYLKLLLLALPLPGAVVAQGYSALREPMRKVFEQFPEADGYRSIVRPVDRSIRANVQDKLPFKIHFNELGDHTVYAALRGRAPVGLIHARSEEGRWGLTEIAWALTLDLKVRSFRFIRCRNRHRNSLQNSAFSKHLNGLDLAALCGLLTDQGQLGTVAPTVPAGSEQLALVVLRSAIKTLVLTKAAWSHDIERLREINIGLQAFPKGTVFRRLRPSTKLKPPDQPTALRHKNTRGIVGSMRAVQVRDSKNRPLGLAVETTIHANRPLVLHWTIQNDGRVARIVTRTSGISHPLREALRRMQGQQLEATPHPSSMTQRIAQELTTRLRDMRGREK